MASRTSIDFSINDFRTILKIEFSERQKRRPKYSLAAFARDIGINANTLNGVFNGFYGLSIDKAKTIAARLNFDSRQSEFFMSLVASKHARTKVARKAALEKLKEISRMRKITKLEKEQLTYFDSWRYPAALEAFAVYGKNLSVEGLAKVLKISKPEAEDSIRALIKMKMLKETALGFERSHEHVKGDSSVPSASIRRFHKQVLDLAKKAIDLQPISNRKVLSSTMTIDSSRVKEAREWLEKMNQQFLDEFGAQKSADRVFAFSTLFFQLDVGAEELL